MAKQPLYGGQFTGTGGTIPATAGYGSPQRGRPSVGVRRPTVNRPQNNRRFPNRRPTSLTVAEKARYYQGQAGVGNIPGGNQGGSHTSGFQRLADMYHGPLNQSRGGGGYGGGYDDYGWAEANRKQEERYQDILAGRRGLIGGVRDRLNTRSDQASLDIENEFIQRESMFSDDLVSRGLRSSTVGQGRNAMYGRAKQAAINTQRDAETQQYISNMVPLYNELYGVMERRNDQGLNPALIAQMQMQRGAGAASAGWSPQYGYGSGFPGEGGGYNVPFAAMGMGWGGAIGGGFGGGGGRRVAADPISRPQNNANVPVNPIFAQAHAMDGFDQAARNRRVGQNPIFG